MSAPLHHHHQGHNHDPNDRPQQQQYHDSNIVDVAVPFTGSQHQESRRHSSTSPSNIAPSSSSPSTNNNSTPPSSKKEKEEDITIMEVEQKFMVPFHDIQTVQSLLANLDFLVPAVTTAATVTTNHDDNDSLQQQQQQQQHPAAQLMKPQKQQFVDWYFDTPFPNLTLCTKDAWLRYRCCSDHHNDHPIPSSDLHMAKIEKKKKEEEGSWEWKRGTNRPTDTKPKEGGHDNHRRQNNNKNRNRPNKVTVYQELTDEDAIHAAMTMLSQHCTTASSNKNHDDSTSPSGRPPQEEQMMDMDGYAIPLLPDALQKYGLQPFARIETTRFKYKMKLSSWSSLLSFLSKKNYNQQDMMMKSFFPKDDMIHTSSSSSTISSSKTMESYANDTNLPTNITIDIDVTDFGYTVGEVEMVVSSIPHQVSFAKHMVQLVASQLGGDSTTSFSSCADADTAVVFGKLEMYLMQNRPDVYEACVNAGTMKQIDANKQE